MPLTGPLMELPLLPLLSGDRLPTSGKTISSTEFANELLRLERPTLEGCTIGECEAGRGMESLKNRFAWSRDCASFEGRGEWGLLDDRPTR